MLKESLEALAVKPGGIYLDGTAGGGGHSAEIASRLEGGQLVSIDKDPQALKAAGERLQAFPQAKTIQGDFADIPQIMDELGIERADGILLDLGVSSHQIDTPGRGFSYHLDAPLDMRMSGRGEDAAHLIANATQSELAKIFKVYGEERFAGKIAAGIIRERENAPIETTGRLVDIIRKAIPAPARREGGHPAKRVFQALRIAVNGELESLERVLATAFNRLNPGGRFVVITFHSLEDRMVKQAFAEFAQGCNCPPDFPVCVCARKPIGRLMDKKPVLAGTKELDANPRAKSAKLRAVEKL